MPRRNKRLKLAGGDSPNGSGVLYPGGHGLSSTTSCVGGRFARSLSAIRYAASNTADRISCSARVVAGECAMDTGKKTTAWKAFRDLWVAGTVGGFLAALMRSVPLDLSKRVEAPSGLFTFDLVLRYAYLLWFIAYFLLSNLRKDELRKWDVAFDVIQSTASFFAAFALGIAVRGEGYQSSEAFQSANGAILAICFFSLLFFGRRDYREGH